MYSTSAYIYIPRQTVVLYSGNSPRRYSLVYAKTLKLHKGVDNKIQFEFLNQEQKPTDITGKEITFRMINYDGTKVLLQKSLTSLLPLKGLAELIVSTSEIEDIDPQRCSYSLEIGINDLNLPVFVNSNAGARADIDVVDSILPAYIPSVEITIPTHPIPENTTETYYSSTLNTSDNSILALQINYDRYSGTAQVQGSPLPSSDWYDIGNPYEYINKTGSIGAVITGYHPYIRIKFISTQGNVTRVLAR